MTRDRLRVFSRVGVVALMTATLLCAQETRRTETHPSPNPVDDSKENSSAVPEVYALTSHFDRIVLVRFKYKADLLAGLEKMVKQENIKNGVILSALGSVRGYQIHQVSNRTMPSQDT